MALRFDKDQEFIEGYYAKIITEHTFDGTAGTSAGGGFGVALPRCEPAAVHASSCIRGWETTFLVMYAEMLVVVSNETQAVERTMQ